MLPPASSRVLLQSLHQAITKCGPGSPFAPFLKVSNAPGTGPEPPRAAKSSHQLGSANLHFAAEPGAAHPAALPHRLLRGLASGLAPWGSAGSSADGNRVRRASRAHSALQGWRGSLPPAGEGTRFRKQLQGCAVGAIPAALSDSNWGFGRTGKLSEGMDGASVCLALVGTGSQCPGLSPGTCQDPVSVANISIM